MATTYQVGSETPYDIKKDDRCPVAKPWGVVDKRNDRLAGCHPFEADANKQAAALYAKEGKDMRHLQLKATTATVTDQGLFSALFASYKTDRVNERIVPGAFEGTIKMWQDSGKRIPLHWEHSERPEDIIGYIDPKSMRETDSGVYVEGKLDLEESSVAREVWRSMRNDAVGLSFGYLIQDQADGIDGTKDLKQLDLFEITLTAKPVNSDTRVLNMKGIEEVLEQAPEDGSVLIVDPDTLFVKANGNGGAGGAAEDPPNNEDLAATAAKAVTEDKDAGEEPHGQPRAQDPLADEVTRDLMDMRLHHTRVFNPLEEVSDVE